MKKLLIVYCLFISSLFLLPNCSITNKAKEEKVTRQKTDSGLEFETIVPGNGESPKVGQIVTVHYKGWLDNNGKPSEKEFDSSYSRNQPFSFKIGAGYVIQGWDEGVLSMKLGEKRRLYIPSNLGYGARGAGNVIPPNANLIFDVELLKLD